MDLGNGLIAGSTRAAISFRCDKRSPGDRSSDQVLLRAGSVLSARQGIRFGLV